MKPKITHVYISHASNSKGTEIGFFRNGLLERGNWYGMRNKRITISSCIRLEKALEGAKDNLYVLPSQLLIVYEIPEKAKTDSESVHDDLFTLGYDTSSLSVDDLARWGHKASNQSESSYWDVLESLALVSGLVSITSFLL